MKIFRSVIIVLLALVAAPSLAIASDSSANIVTNESYTTPAVYVPAVANEDSQRLPENCGVPIYAVGNGKVNVMGNDIEIVSPGKRGNLSHKYPNSGSWCAVVAGRFSDGQLIGYAFGNGHKPVSTMAPGMKIIQADSTYASIR